MILPKSLSAHAHHRAGRRNRQCEAVRPGQYVSVGTQVISLVPLPNVWVVANYKEAQMTRQLRPIRARDSGHFPGVVLRGHVELVSSLGLSVLLAPA